LIVDLGNRAGAIVFHAEQICGRVPNKVAKQTN